MEVFLMSQNISDTEITNVIDQITAATKGFVASYTTTESEDLFRIIVREQNPEDLASGTTYSETVDDSLAAGTAFYSIWGGLLTWLASRASANGSTTIDGLLVDRYLRVPHTFNKYIYYPTYGTDITSANVFPDQYWNGSTWTTYSLGTYAHGDSLPRTLTADTLDAAISCFWGVVKITNAIDPGTNFVFNVTVTYADGSSTAGTETVTCYQDAILGTYYDIGATAHAYSVLPAATAPSYNEAGQKVVSYASSTKFTVGQKILLWTSECQALLTTSAAAGDLHVHVPVTDVGAYNVSDLIYIFNRTPVTELNSIENIDYENGIIHLSIPIVAATFTTALHASIYKRGGVLTGNCSASNAVPVSVLDARRFAAGDLVVMNDTTPSTEPATILSINYGTGVITLTGVTTLNYTTAAGATITLASDLIGRAEEHIIAFKDVAAANTITTTDNLLHTYNTADCKSIRLLESIPTVATPVVSGTAADAVAFEPRRERVITQGSIINTP